MLTSRSLRRGGRSRALTAPCGSAPGRGCAAAARPAAQTGCSPPPLTPLHRPCELHCKVMSNKYTAPRAAFFAGSAGERATDVKQGSLLLVQGGEGHLRSRAASQPPPAPGSTRAMHVDMATEENDRGKSKSHLFYFKTFAFRSRKRSEIRKPAIRDRSTWPEDLPCPGGWGGDPASVPTPDPHSNPSFPHKSTHRTLPQ